MPHSPAEKTKESAQSDRIPMITRATPPPRRGAENAKVRTNLHVCARERQKNEDMTRGRDGTKVQVVVMKGGTK